jgi:hypothetical protein
VPVCPHLRASAQISASRFIPFLTSTTIHASFRHSPHFLLFTLVFRVPREPRLSGETVSRGRTATHAPRPDGHLPFPQRLWSTRHYKPRPGAPVIVIDNGEMGGEDRLPFLDTGIADSDMIWHAQAAQPVSLGCAWAQLLRCVYSACLHVVYMYGVVSGEFVGVRNLSTGALRCAPTTSQNAMSAAVGAACVARPFAPADTDR